MVYVTIDMYVHTYICMLVDMYEAIAHTAKEVRTGISCYDLRMTAIDQV